MHAAAQACSKSNQPFMLRMMQVTAADFTGKTEIVPLERRRPEDDRIEHSFEFRKQRFCYDPDAHAFQKLPYPVQVTLPCCPTPCR
jgi:cation-transporting ATPase 13A1